MAENGQLLSTGQSQHRLLASGGWNDTWYSKAEINECWKSELKQVGSLHKRLFRHHMSEKL